MFVTRIIISHFENLDRSADEIICRNIILCKPYIIWNCTYILQEHAERTKKTVYETNYANIYSMKNTGRLTPARNLILAHNYDGVLTKFITGFLFLVKILHISLVVPVASFKYKQRWARHSIFHNVDYITFCVIGRMNVFSFPIT